MFRLSTNQSLPPAPPSTKVPGQVVVASSMEGSGGGGGGGSGVSSEGHIVQKTDIAHSHCLPDTIVRQWNSVLAALSTEHLKREQE